MIKVFIKKHNDSIVSVEIKGHAGQAERIRRRGHSRAHIHRVQFHLDALRAVRRAQARGMGAGADRDAG